MLLRYAESVLRCGGQEVVKVRHADQARPSGVDSLVMTPLFHYEFTVGGRVRSIAIDPDTSGLTQSLVPAGRMARGLVASSGYLGAAVVGCVLMAATRVEN